jgi:hypothetical protein
MKNMLRHKEPNAYNLFEIRRLKVPSPHCEYINLPLKYNLEQSLVNWISTNLKGRFYVGKSVALREQGTETVCKVGFEDAKELSYFTLACPLLKYK